MTYASCVAFCVSVRHQLSSFMSYGLDVGQDGILWPIGKSD
jgi:hypothetical protein